MQLQFSFLSSSFYFQQANPSALKHDSSVVSPEAERTRNSRSNSLLQRPGVTNFRGRAVNVSCRQVHLQLRSSLRLARFTQETGQYEQWRNMATLEDVLDFCKFCFCPTFFSMILSPFPKVKVLKELKKDDEICWKKVKVPPLFLWTRWSPRALRINGWRHKNFGWVKNKKRKGI